MDDGVTDSRAHGNEYAEEHGKRFVYGNVFYCENRGKLKRREAAQSNDHDVGKQVVPLREKIHDGKRERQTDEKDEEARKNFLNIKPHCFLIRVVQKLQFLNNFR
jgi:hypothetical protein